MMHTTRIISMLAATALLQMHGMLWAQTSAVNSVTITPGETPEQIIRKAANITPSPRQYAWQLLEMTGFIHFGKNTFDDVEWGKKDTNLSVFDPTALDATQWVTTCKAAGIKLVIIVAKHHDGLCLWPSKYSQRTVAQTPYRGGKGDIVKEVASACRKAGLKFGVYLSPWDMNHPLYGTEEYNEIFRNQLTELLTQYGTVSEVWFDGANGEGPNGKRQVYDWTSYYAVIRKLAPNAVIAVSGPDVRWVGTESGYGRKTEWSVLPRSAQNQDSIAARSQQTNIDGTFVPRDMMGEDLGSREIITKASSLFWYPAETNTSIRPRWFYHESDDIFVYTPMKLVDIYFNSVGLNGVLLLNVPPDKRGLIHEKDVASLKGMRYIIDETFKHNLASGGTAASTSEQKNHRAASILDNDLKTSWEAKEDASSASIDIRLKHPRTFNRAMLQENILKGQRVEKFHCAYLKDSTWVTFAEGTTIGYKRLFRFPLVTADRIRITIDECRTNPTLSSFGIYLAPPGVTIASAGSSFGTSVDVDVRCDRPDAALYYTVDGSVPDRHSMKYAGRLRLDTSTVLTALAIAADGTKGVPESVAFHKALYSYELKSACSGTYPGSGTYTLVDGMRGSINYKDGRWQGFEGKDFEAVIDLGAVKNIGTLSIRFMHYIRAGVFLPSSVEYALSDDGKEFARTHEIKNTIPLKENSTVVNPFTCELTNTSARYIRIRAKSIGLCPPWSKTPGVASSMFADEIEIK